MSYDIVLAQLHTITAAAVLAFFLGLYIGRSREKKITNEFLLELLDLLDRHEHRTVGPAPTKLPIVMACQKCAGFGLVGVGATPYPAPCLPCRGTGWVRKNQESTDHTENRDGSNSEPTTIDVQTAKSGPGEA